MTAPFEDHGHSAQTTPLFVDVDGTLTPADLSLESFVAIARSGVGAFLQVLFWLLRGRSFAKAMAARRAPIDPARICYRPEVLELIAQAQAEGRPVILASASHWRNIRRIARHLGLSTDILGTRAKDNRKGAAKLAAIRQRIGPDARFDYVGDARVDRSIWQAARQGWSVGYLPPDMNVRPLAPPRKSPWKVVFRAMRPHQWSKNALVLVPAFTSGAFVHPPVMLTALAAMLLMSLVASAIYLVNDVLDIEADRAHRTKHSRPIASGDLSIPNALILSALLGIAGLAGAWWLGGYQLLLWFIIYVALTTAYSFRLKSVMVGDAIVLASLYTIRIWLGGVAIGVPLSFWLLLFSEFLFLSLAYLKRYVEMRDATDDDRLLSGRGYVGGDLEVVMTSGVSAGMVAVLILALFAHEPETYAHYALPQLLMLACLPLLYWLNRIWLMARRGEVEGDPVAFAIKDRRSILIGVTIALIFLAALYGVPLDNLSS